MMLQLIFQREDDGKVQMSELPDDVVINISEGGWWKGSDVWINYLMMLQLIFQREDDGKV